MIFLIALLACSVKGSVELAKAERAYQLGQEQNLRDADMFAWTMANSYLKKAREEYANSSYEQAAILAARSTEWLNKITPPETSPDEASEEDLEEDSDEDSEQDSEKDLEEDSEEDSDEGWDYSNAITESNKSETAVSSSINPSSEEQ